MQRIKLFINDFSVTRYLLRWLLLVLPVSIITGSLVALFLWSLDKVTQLRWQNAWLIWLLPLAGVLIYLLYRYLGDRSEGGNNLLMEEIHTPGGGVPARMAPLVLVTTLITHLFGGSAGREGTAVQMGGSISGFFARLLKLPVEDTRIILMTGIAAGFGAVFGTPIAGTVFALEVLAIGSIRYDALLPCLAAAILADITCAAWGIHHTVYHIAALDKSANTFLHINGWLLLKALIAGIAFGLAGYLFASSQLGIKKLATSFIKQAWLRPVVGALVVIALCVIVDSRDYLGLGVQSQSADGISIVNAFTTGNIPAWSWLLKLLFTAITLGMGFKGGEVTPLFFIGATLGHTLAIATGAPIDLFAGLGFIAVFAGATNTPLACTLMGVELFGGEHIVYYAIACFTAYYFSGHAGIYTAQRLVVRKPGAR